MAVINRDRVGRAFELLAESLRPSVDRGMPLSRGRRSTTRSSCSKITPASWDPATDSRIPVWEVTQHLIKRLDDSGEQAAADLLRHVLAYRLYSIRERKKWAKDALGFNALVTSWPAIARLTSSQDQNSATQETMFP